MLVLIIWLAMKNNIHAVFFDLDGTLLDTAPDLYTAMLETLAHFGHESISFKNFRPQVHAGTKGMVLASFSIDETHPDYATIRETFLKRYQQRLTEKTQFFSGIPKVLDYLDTHKIPWGIVTNKPAYLTEPLLKHFKINKRSQCIVSGDTLTNKKPHPEPLLHACQLLQVSPKQAVYVGDTEIDVQATKAAGMIAIAVCYGYHKSDSQPEAWGADYMIESALELLTYLQRSPSGEG